MMLHKVYKIFLISAPNMNNKGFYVNIGIVLSRLITSIALVNSFGFLIAVKI